MARSRIGILGGTFDPPHYGHLLLADAAREALDADCILFVPAGDPPHKKDDTRLPIHHRLAMLQLATADDPNFGISPVDMDRPGPHYTADTLRILGEQHPGTELVFLMGGDSLRDLPNWHQPHEIIERARLGVMRRTDCETPEMLNENLIPGLWERVTIIDAPLVGISSTDIVERLQAGRSVRYMLPPPILRYIHEHRLYLR